MSDRSISLVVVTVGSALVIALAHLLELVAGVDAVRSVAVIALDNAWDIIRGR